MFKRFIIKLFRLTDIKNLLIQERKNQEKKDEKIWTKKIKDIELKLKREYELKFQSFEAENFLQLQRIEAFEKLEDSLNSAKHYVRKRAKENALISASIVHKIKEFSFNTTKLYEEINGVEIEAKRHLEKIEKRMLKEG